jgi:hypothetical protein
VAGVIQYPLAPSSKTTSRHASILLLPTRGEAKQAREYFASECQFGNETKGTAFAVPRNLAIATRNYSERSRPLSSLIQLHMELTIVILGNPPSQEGNPEKLSRPDLGGNFCEVFSPNTSQQVLKGIEIALGAVDACESIS